MPSKCLWGLGFRPFRLCRQAVVVECLRAFMDRFVSTDGAAIHDRSASLECGIRSESDT
jgi:hypothetical protein